MKKIKFLVKMLLGFIIILLITFILNGTIEYSKIVKEIENFKSRGVLVYEDKENHRFFYEIKSTEVTRTFDYNYLYDEDQNNDYFGDIGDITITNRNPLREYPFNEFIEGFAKWLYIGHATINVSGAKVIESEGKEEGVVRIVDNFWLEDNSFPQIIGLKVKTTEEEKIKAVENAKDKIGLKYNWFFLASLKDRYYCTDLISRSYVNNNLNYDGFLTTGNDLIYNKETYIYYFQEKVYNNGKSEVHIYYLK